MSAWGRSAAYRIAFAYSAAFALAMLALGTAVYLAADRDSGASAITRSRRSCRAPRRSAT